MSITGYPDAIIASHTPPNLAGKMAEIMGELTTLEKGGEFKIDGKLLYKFVRAVDSYEAVQKQLAKRGIALLAEDAEIVGAREAGRVHITDVKVSLRLCDSESGETMCARWLGSGQDTAEKGIAKAITGAVKSWLLTTFLIPSGIDPDEDGQSGGAKRQAAAKKQTAADRKTMAGLLKAFIRDGRRSDDEQNIRLRLKLLNVNDVQDYNKAVVGLDAARARTLMEWLDEELVKRQGPSA